MPNGLGAQMSAIRTIGTIKFFKGDRGFGFVSTDDHREFFLHISQWVGGTEPVKGERVSFIEDVGRDRRPYARQVMRA